MPLRKFQDHRLVDPEGDVLTYSPFRPNRPRRISSNQTTATTTERKFKLKNGFCTGKPENTAGNQTLP